MAKTIFKPVSSTLSQLLGDIGQGKLALPELQRPFVWQKTAVRNLLDSMYKGFPIGYLMFWNTADADWKVIGTNGKQHTPTEFIIDGQQRLTSLYAVMTGAEITFKDFSKGRIRIAFRPRDARFEVTDAAVERDPEFLPDVTELWRGEDWEVIEAFLERLRQTKPEALQDGQEKQLRHALSHLRSLEDFPLQAVQIGHEVDEEDVAEIFLRVNSGGTKLTQADFILTHLSVFERTTVVAWNILPIPQASFPPTGCRAHTTISSNRPPINFCGLLCSSPSTVGDFSPCLRSCEAVVSMTMRSPMRPIEMHSWTNSPRRSITCSI
jgi:hypothetical protein